MSITRNTGEGRRAGWALALTALLLFTWAQLAAVSRESPTVDEQGHLSRGLTYALTGDLRLYTGHPPLINLLAAWPLLPDARVRLPLDDPAWRTPDWVEFSISLFWKSDHPVPAMYTAARAMVVLLGVAFLAVIYRLGADVGAAAGAPGWLTGLAAMTLAALDPNLRAHARLVTTDVGVTLMLTLTVWLWRRWLWRPRPVLAVGAGLALGLALASKYTAVLFVPPLVLAAGLAWGLNRRVLWRLAGALAAAGLTVWAIYGFEARPALGLPFPVPLATYWDEFIWTTNTLRFPSYLLGRVTHSASPMYFPVALLVKLPAPLLGLALAGLAIPVAARWRAEFLLWSTALTYFVVAVFSAVNIGLRHVLPVAPALYCAAALALVRLAAAGRFGRWAGGGLLVWSVLTSLAVYPRDLTYFNELAGGPEKGYLYLVDSNLDWGQDLGALVEYVQRERIDPIYVSYFGTVPIGSFPVRQFPLPARPLPPRPTPDWHPLFPTPGWYAISLTHLLGGAVLEDADTFAFFRHQRPETILGRTIYIYRVPAETGTLALCVDPPPSLGEASARRIFGPALDRLIPFDCARGLPLPRGLTWYLLRGEQVVLVRPALERLGAELVFDQPHAADPAFAFSLYRLDDAAGRAAAYPAESAAAPAFGGLMRFLGRRCSAPLEAGRPGQVETVWQVDAALPEPMSVFLHLAAPDGFPLAVSDGLNTPFDRLRAGDALIQFHPLDEYPADLPPGAQFRAGLYALGGAQARYRLPSGEDFVSFPLSP